MAFCLAKGEGSAGLADHGLVRILSPRKDASTMVFPLHFLDPRAFGMRFRERAPEINCPQRRALFRTG